MFVVFALRSPNSWEPWQLWDFYEDNLTLVLSRRLVNEAFRRAFEARYANGRPNVCDEGLRAYVCKRISVFVYVENGDPHENPSFYFIVFCPRVGYIARRQSTQFAVRITLVIPSTIAR